MLAAATIASLAVLRVNYDTRGWDYIDNFVVFAAEALRACGNQPSNLNVVRQVVSERFGLSLPAGVMKTILRRACDRGLASSVGRDQYSPLIGKIDELGFARTRESAIRQSRALGLRLVEFSKTTGDGIASVEDAEQAILEYVTAQSASLLPAIAEARVPSAPGAGDVRPIVHQFVVALHRSDPEGYTYLETIVKGAFLRSAAYVQDLGRVQARFEQLDVYLDTRILLRALGLAGPVQESATRELLDLTYELGARLQCFDHTIAEVTRVLSSVGASLRTRTTFLTTSSETLEYLSSIGFRQSDVETLISELPRRLAGIRISITPRPSHEPSLTIDEVDFANRLREGARGAYSDDAVGHDVDAITATHRLRHGERMPVLEHARAIFVTTNALLVRTAAGYFGTNDRTRTTPLAMNEHEFATVAWLKKPTAAPNLPAGLAIADSYAALNPPERVWHAYLEEIARLETRGSISEGEYFALRYSTTAKAALWGITRGRPEAVSEASIPAILARVRESIAAEVAPRLREEGRAEERGATAKELAEWKRRATEAELEAARLRSEKKAAQLRKDARAQGLAAGTGRWVSRIVFIPLALVIACVTWVSLGSLVPELPIPNWIIGIAQPLAPIAAIVAFIVGMLLMVRGGSFGGWRRSLEVAVSRRVLPTFRRLVGGD